LEVEVIRIYFDWDGVSKRSMNVTSDQECIEYEVENIPEKYADSVALLDAAEPLIAPDGYTVACIPGVGVKRYGSLVTYYDLNREAREGKEMTRALHCKPLG